MVPAGTGRLKMHQEASERALLQEDHQSRHHPRKK